jgi:hypothetical protein
MSFQIFGGETLMKWREPNAYVRKFFRVEILLLVLFLLFMFVVFGVTFAIKSNGKPINFTPMFAISIFFLVWFFVTWFLPGASIHLKELCVTRRLGKSSNRSNYSEIESATVHLDNYKDKRFFVIRFKLKEKPTLNTKVLQIVIPEDVNLERILQILRDKGVKVVEGPLPS